ncbi:MAG TPA: ABC transporter permease subunit [Planctomycetota bacterium]|nr:ABC transporter permease subunit [Planctomycetota bacterium]
MVIHDRSYSRWQGDRAAPVKAAAAIVAAGIKRGTAIVFRRKIPAVLLILVAFGPFVFFLLLLYFAAFAVSHADQFPEGMVEGLRDSHLLQVITPSPEWVYTYMFLWQCAFVVVACLLIGAGLIAEDRRANALEMYLSRPVSVRQYLLGKLATIGFFVALVTVIPTVIMILAQLSVSWSQAGEVLRLLKLLAGTLLGGAVWVLIPSLTILTASSLADRARNAAILWMGVVVMLEFVVSNILREVFNADSFYLLQLGFNIRQVLNAVLGNATDIVATVPVWQSALVLLAWVVICIRVLHVRVKPVEVVA